MVRGRVWMCHGGDGTVEVFGHVEMVVEVTQMAVEVVCVLMNLMVVVVVIVDDNIQKLIKISETLFKMKKKPLEGFCCHRCLVIVVVGVIVVVVGDAVTVGVGSSRGGSGMEYGDVFCLVE